MPSPGATAPDRSFPFTVVTGRRVRSRAGRAKRRRDLLDGLWFRRAHALSVLAVGGGGLAGEGECEPRVVFACRGGRVGLGQRHGGAKVAAAARPEVCGRVIS